MAVSDERGKILALGRICAPLPNAAISPFTLLLLMSAPWSYLVNLQKAAISR
jgi:hypothetical protein